MQGSERTWPVAYCPPVYVDLPTVCQVEQNYNYNGNDLSHAPSASGDACCATCQTTPLCKFWSWNRATDKDCYLKVCSAAG